MSDVHLPCNPSDTEMVESVEFDGDTMFSKLNDDWPPSFHMGDFLGIGEAGGGRGEGVEASAAVLIALLDLKKVRPHYRWIR